jgi:hypothetical protein
LIFIRRLWQEIAKNQLLMLHQNYLNMIDTRAIHPEHQGEHLEFITEDQLMEYLKKGRTWVWMQRKSGLLKAYKVGRTNYFLLKDVQQQILNGAWG